MSCLQVLIFLGQFNYPDTYWRYNIAGHRQCRMFLEHTEVNFLKQVIEELMKDDAPHNLILTNKQELLRNVTGRENFGCRNQQMLKFRIPRGGSKAKNRIATLQSRLTCLGIFLEEYHGIQPWREKGSRRPVCFSRITSSKFKNGPSQWTGNQVNVAGSLHG